MSGKDHQMVNLTDAAQVLLGFTQCGAVSTKKLLFLFLFFFFSRIELFTTLASVVMSVCLGLKLKGPCSPI